MLLPRRASRFNLAFPARAVRKGDRILVVNGKYGRRIFAPDGELTMSASCDIKIERSRRESEAQRERAARGHGGCLSRRST